jgi:hypothetical protein
MRAIFPILIAILAMVADGCPAAERPNIPWLTTLAALAPPQNGGVLVSMSALAATYRPIRARSERCWR